jgi:hypothetical protein
LDSDLIALVPLGNVIKLRQCLQDWDLIQLHGRSLTAMDAKCFAKNTQRESEKLELYDIEGELINVSDLFAYSLRAFSLRPLRLKKSTWIKADRKLSTSALNLMTLPGGTK